MQRRLTEAPGAHDARERDPADPRRAAAVRKRHQLSLKNRESLSVEGVQNVESFDDHTVVLETDQGVMNVRGEGLHIKELNLEAGTLQVDGFVHMIEYAGEPFAKRSKGLLGRLFR